MKHTRFLLPLASLALSGIASASTLQFVDVRDSGNAADTNGRGAVSYDFSIMKFEFTNAQYAAFLNTVDPTGANSLGLYSINMNNGLRGGINSPNLSAPVGSRYVVKPNFGDKPADGISWFDAARVANWLHNGGTASSSTETGAYTVTGLLEGNSPSTVARNPGATFWIPTQDEWYKAAFYNGDGTYWDYATESNTAPTSVSADATGVGSAGPTGNFANYNNGADWNPDTSTNGNVTSVGTNGRSSHYGTYDMNGNVREVIEGTAGSSTMSLLGGAYSSGSGALIATATPGSANAFASALTNGFRLATNAPEPGSTIPLLTLFGLGMAKSRRRKA
ncbi:MAG: hypothetical protein RLZZ179_247 [Verrucomicrobiota bacterium]|jgi:formylglycine-generating enzyme required for sulfatase activity